MKPILFLAVFFICSVSYGQRSELKWGSWQQSPISGIDYRVTYDYYNQFSAKAGKPAHVWCIQIRNNFDKKIGISWCLGDDGKTRAEIKDDRRNSCMNPGEIWTSGLHFTNTPRGGNVSTYFWDLKDCK